MKKLVLIMSILSLLALCTTLQADDNKTDNAKLQRSAKGVFDIQESTQSNFQFSVSNFGPFNINLDHSTESGFWPRGSQNKYVYGGGFWFGAKKTNPKTQKMQKYVAVSYDPNTALSYFVPGSIEDGNELRTDLKDKQRIYVSTDFNEYTGEPYNSDDGPNWPLWIFDKTQTQFGALRHRYENNTGSRNRDAYPDGPMYVSDEDIICIYKDTDISYYNAQHQLDPDQGYPLGLEVESRIYTWNKEEMNDVVIIRFLVRNSSDETLRDCYFANVYDLDVGYIPDIIQQSQNDRCRFYEEDPSLNLAVAWTDTDLGEANKGIGYLGLSLLETPAVDEEGFIRNDKLIYTPEEQIGLTSFRNWPIKDDFYEDEAKYDFISSDQIDGELGPDDIRMHMATGPFNMKPGDVCRVTFALTFAMPAKGGEADGTFEDLTGFAQGERLNKITDVNTNSLMEKLLDTKDYYYMIQSAVDGDIPVNEATIANIYPNPVKNEFELNYTLPYSCTAKISIIDQMGQEIVVLNNSCKESGNHYERYSIADLHIPNGLYLLKIDTGKDAITQKILVVK